MNSVSGDEKMIIQFNIQRLWIMLMDARIHIAEMKLSWDMECTDFVRRNIREIRVS